MGQFTEKLEAWRKGEIEEIDSDILNELIVSVILPALKNRLGITIESRSVFGAERHEDITQNAVIWIKEHLLNPDTLSSKIVDTKSLVLYMCNWVAQRRNKEHKYIKGEGKRNGRKKGGQSQLGKTSDGDARTHDSISDADNRLERSQAFPELQDDIEAVLELALKDLTSWFGEDSCEMKVFQERMSTSASQKQIAEKFGLTESRVTLILQAAKFCIMRRFGYEQSYLQEHFRLAEKWESELLVIESHREPS